MRDCPVLRGFPRARTVPLALFTGMLLVSVPTSASCQELLGEVRTADSVPVPGAAVELHQVTEDAGSVIDSARTDAGGRFLFRLPETADRGIVFLPAARHQGIVYWGMPVHAADDDGGGEVQRLVVYDTALVDRPATDLEVAMRHLVVTPVPGAGLSVEEVIDVTGREGFTLVSVAEDAPVWQTSLGLGARIVTPATGGVAPQQLLISDGRVGFTGALPPDGVRIALRYVVPSMDVRLTVEHATRRFEAVVMDMPALEVEATGLSEVRADSDMEIPMRRFSGRGLRSGAALALELGWAASSRLTAWLWLLAAFVLAGAGAVAGLRGRRHAERVG